MHSLSIATKHLRSVSSLRAKVSYALVLLGCMVFPSTLAAQVVDYAGLQVPLRLTPDAPVTGTTSPVGIAIDASGNRYIVDPSLTHIIEISAAGVQSNLVTTGITAINGATAINFVNSGPGFLVVTSSDSGGTIYQINLGTGAASSIGAGTSLGTITGLAVVFPNIYYATSSAVMNYNLTTTTSVTLPSGAVPVALASDIYGNVYISDSGNFNILKVPAGGSSASVYKSYGFALVYATSTPAGLAVDPSGNVYLAAKSANVFQIRPGSGGTHLMGVGFGQAYGLASDTQGNIYVTDYTGPSTLPAVQIIRPGAVDLGTANVCPVGGSGSAPCTTSATLVFNIDGGDSNVTDIAARVATSGALNADFTAAAPLSCVLSMSDMLNNIGSVTTCQLPVSFTPTAAGLRLGAVDVTSNSGTKDATVFLHGVGVAPLGAFDSGIITTIPFVFAFSGANAWGSAVDAAGNVYVTDNNYCYLYKYSPATLTQTTVVGTSGGNCSGGGDGGAAVSADFFSPDYITIDGRGNLYVADSRTVRKIDALTGVLSTVTGNHAVASSYTADGMLAAGSPMGTARGVAVDASGNLYVVDRTHTTIRKIDVVSGLLSTVVGAGGNKIGFYGDGGPALGAYIEQPEGLALDAAGNLFFGDSQNNVIRRVDANTGIITTVAGTAPATPVMVYTSQSNSGYSGDNGPATSAKLNDAEGIAVDAAGNLYIGDSGNKVARKVDAATQTITTIAGYNDGLSSTSGTLPYPGEGLPAKQAPLGYMENVTVDGSGNLYITDYDNGAVRKVTAASTAVAFTPSLPVGTSSAATDIPFSNIGNAPLTLSALTNPADFNLQGAHTNCSTSTPLASGASCVFGFEFLPTAAGALSETFIATDNSLNLPTSTQTVAELGTGLPVVATELLFVPATVSPLAPGANLGTLTVDIGGSTGAVATTATNTVSISITGPNGFTAGPFSGTVVNGVATFALGSTALPSGGAYVVTATSSPALTPAVLNVTVSTPTKLAFTPAPPTGVIYGGNLGTVTLSVEDASSNVLGVSVPLTAVITDPNGLVTTINGNSTNASGIATYDTSTQTFTTPGNYTIVVSSPGLTSASANFTVAPAPATKLGISPVPSTVTINGNLGTVTVSVENAAGAVVTTANYPLTITISGPNGFSVNATGPAVNGVAVINVANIVFNTLGTYTITATNGDLNAFAPATFTVVTAPAATKLALSGVAATVVAGGNLGNVTVSVETAQNAVVSTATNLITVTITGPNGFSVSAQGTAVNGVATISLANIALNAGGSYSIHASSPNLASSPPVAFTVLGVPTQLALGGVAPTVAFGGSQGTVTVSVETNTSVVVSTSTVSITLMVTGPGGLLRTFTASAVSGVASFNLAGVLYAPAGTYTLTATSPNLTSATTTFTVSPAAAAQAAQLAEAGLPATVTQGGNLGSAVTMSVETAAGAVVTSSSAPVTITITGPGGYTQTVTVAAVNGVAHFDLSAFVFATLGNYTVTATSPGLATLLFPFIVQQDFTLASTVGGTPTQAPPPQTVVPGAPAVYQLVLAPAGSTFTGPITLTAAGLPPGATYSFSPPTVTPGAAAASSTLTVTTSSMAELRNHGPGLAAIALAALLLPFGSRRLRQAARKMSVIRLLFALMIIGTLAGLGGCATGGLYGHSPASYVITVTGTSGTISHSTTVTLIEQ